MRVWLTLADLEGAAHRRFNLERNGFDEPHAIALFRGDATATFQDQRVHRIRDDTRAGENNPCEIQRIDSGNEKPRFICSRFSDRSQFADGRFLGELLASDSRHESSTTNLAAQLQSAEGSNQFMPRRSGCFARQQVSEYHAVASQQ